MKSFEPPIYCKLCSKNASKAVPQGLTPYGDSDRFARIVFSGIVETTSPIFEKSLSGDATILRVKIERPQSFDDIKLGDSICTNGVCLTVEAFDAKTIQFAIGLETMKITGWSLDSLEGKKLNLERSLKLGDRIHGHFVTGHVDAQGQIVKINRHPEFVEMTVQFPESLKGYFWKKGSVCIDGVSLTVNTVAQNTLTVGLIPETLKVTNLSSLQEGSKVNLEVDFMSRAFINYFNERRPQ